MASIPLRNRMLAETLGTGILVFAGCGAILVNTLYGAELGHVGISLVFGLVVMALIYALGNISGAHINPAVSIAFWLSGRLPRDQVLPYLLSQLVGAVIAAGALKLLFPAAVSLGATLPSGSPTQAFVFELLMSWFLMFVIFSVSTGHQEKGFMAGIAVGGTVALEALLGGPVSGASMNPARSIGPALVAGQWQHLWIYIAAPVLGMALAWPACRWVQGPDCCTEKIHDKGNTGTHHA